jgi:hypothetical protein
VVTGASQSDTVFIISASDGCGGLIEVGTAGCETLAGVRLAEVCKLLELSETVERKVRGYNMHFSSIAPSIVVTVRFQEIVTNERGRKWLRNPTITGIRTDKQVNECDTLKTDDK